MRQASLGQLLGGECHLMLPPAGAAFCRWGGGAVPLCQDWLALPPFPQGCLDTPRMPRQGTAVCGLHTISDLF